MSSTMQKLDGLWEIMKDPGNCGKDGQWHQARPGEGVFGIQVPGPVQEAFPFYDGVAWYFKTFRPELDLFDDGKIFLHFTAVDYLCEVWLNGTWLARHEDSEEPFQVDVTAIVAAHRDNFLAVRVVTPAEEPVDGLTIHEIPRRNKVNLGFTPGSVLNYGGIVGPVTLVSEPAVRIRDLVVLPDWETGKVSFQLAIQNDLASEETMTLSCHVHEVAGSRHVLTASRELLVQRGESRLTLEVGIAGHQLWSVGHPFLYNALLTLAESGTTAGSSKAVRFGFKDFRIKNGFFFLNGKRIFLRCAHTGNCLPVGGTMSRDAELVMRDLHYAKALGFNAVRFIAGIALPQQLDLCDEIGLLVYEESYAGWCLGDSPKAGEYFARSAGNMIRRDRNHVCVAIWGLLNETFDTSVFRIAVRYLPEARALDPSRLILLGSGRFDNRPEIGSVSNPHSDRWEYEWGHENEEGLAAVPSMDRIGEVAPYMRGMGDIHLYPPMPHNSFIRSFIRSAGGGSKPVFLSEYGVGSQNNIIQELLKYEEHGETRDLEDIVMYRKMAGRLTRDWQTYGLDGVYLSPEDFLLDSMRHNCRQRQASFDLIRANPMMCGYSLTGLLDHAFTGEGLWTFWREFKPGMADTLREGWAPLRWSLFFDKACAVAGSTLTAEAVLCNEDVLPPGRYPAVFRVKGRDGIVFSRETDITLPAAGYANLPPLAVSVFNEALTIKTPGLYEFGAWLLRGGSPAGGRLVFRVVEPCGKIRPGKRIAAWNIGRKAVEWMSSHGADAEDFLQESCVAPDLVLVGNPVMTADNKTVWEKLLSLVSGGATAVIFAPDTVPKEGAAAGFLPFSEPARFISQPRWLYHTDNIHIRHELFREISDDGLVDYEVFDSLYPDMMLDCGRKPDKTICAAIGIGQMNPDGYVSGISAGEYRSGRGKIMVNCFRVPGSVGDNPLADLMLRNILAGN